MPRDFKNIKAWQYADDLAVLIYSKTKSFPKEELYGITSQLRRSAVSIPTNIAEGASSIKKNTLIFYILPKVQWQRQNICCTYQSESDI
jgi:hypothetical protein